MTLFQKHNSLIVLFIFAALVQGCSGGASAQLESAAEMDTARLPLGDSVIAQAVSGGFYEIPTDPTTDPVEEPGDGSGGGGTGSEPTPTEPTDSGTGGGGSGGGTGSNPTPTEPDPVVVIPTPVPYCDELATGSTQQCKEREEIEYCDPNFIAKHAKKGYKGHKIQFVSSSNFRFDGKHGKHILVGTAQHNTVLSINGYGGKLTLCGVKVRTVTNTNGRLILNHSEIDSMDKHKGHLELDYLSRVYRINQSQCSVKKR